jgi:hypothetical protein
MVRPLAAQMQIVSFVKTDFSGRTDVVDVWYSVINNDLSNYSRFRFQGKM